MSRQDHPLLVIVGMPGAGKSVVAEYLRVRGWPVVYFGGMTLRELTSRGLPHNEQNERLVREQLRQVYGQDAYAKLSLPDINAWLCRGPTAVDGLYSWAEYRFLRANISHPMYVCAIVATRSVRYARLAARPTRPLTATEAETRDMAEIEKLDKGGPIAIADYTVVNDGTREELEASIDALLGNHIMVASTAGGR